MPQQLRRLFVRILLHCQPLHPEELWKNFKIVMSEDYISHFGTLQEQNKAYTQINSILCAEGKSFADFLQMEQLINNSTKQYKQLDCKQKEIINLLLSKLDNNNNHNNYWFYIDGPGKTFIYTTIYYLARIINKHACTMVFTGIAATLTSTEKTVHKIFELLVPLFAYSSFVIKIHTNGTMICLEIIDRTLHDIMNNNLSFGGKIFFIRSKIINLSIKFSFTWRHFVKFSLTQNMRVLLEEIYFAKFLLDMEDVILNDNRNYFYYYYIIYNYC
ncbi:hypothetical protein ACFW04_014616 [Cataglyphis niger]